MANQWLGGEDPRLVPIEAELGMLRLDGDAPLPDQLHALAELLGAARVVIASITTGALGLGLEHWRAVLAPAGLRELVEALLATPIPGAAPFEPASVDARSRNRAFDLGAWLDRDAPGTWQDSPLAREVGAPLGLATPHAVGALVYDGDVLLGWFGAVLPEPPTSRQLDMLDSLVPVVHRRLLIERTLRSASRQERALAAALDQLGAAAFVLGPTGAICETNAVARAVLADRHAEILGALADVFAGRASALPFELRPIANGAGWLAILRASTVDERIAEAVAVASVRWNLTPRQRDVLDLVARGHANATIGACLGVSERTVELHVSALLDRAGVDNRASLVSRVLS